MLSLIRRLPRLAAMFDLWLARESLRRLALASDDRLLYDIGLTRDDLDAMLQGNDNRIRPVAEREVTGAPTPVQANQSRRMRA